MTEQEIRVFVAISVICICYCAFWCLVYAVIDYFKNRRKNNA